MEREALNFLKVWSIIFASLSYCYFIVSKLPYGKYRLFSLFPIFTIFTILPLHLSTVLPAGITSFFITWLANFKLLLFAFNLGPLSSSHDHQPIKSLSFLQFLFISALPIKIKNNPPLKITKIPSKVLPLNFWSKTVIFAIFVGICDIYKTWLEFHNFLVFFIYCCMLYLFIDIMMEFANMIVGSILHVELFPPSDEPYVSTSLSDFWGRRWNLMVTDILRHTVYEPIRAFLSIFLGREYLIWARIFATWATFLVSGLMHELIYYYMARVSPTWDVTWYFVLQGVCVTLEVGLKKVMGRVLGLHWAVSGPLSVGFVMGTGYLWFFPPLLRNKLDVRAIEEVTTLFDLAKEIFK